MEFNNKSVVLEWSFKQKCFHIHGVFDMLVKNARCFVNGGHTDYVPIGVFKSSEEASAAAMVFRRKRPDATRDFLSEDEIEMMVAESMEDDITLEQAFSMVEAHAKEVSDGHFTLMRFTSGWKAMFKTPELTMDNFPCEEGEDFGGAYGEVASIPMAKTIDEAICQAMHATAVEEKEV